jgi:hypothetical protein
MFRFSIGIDCGIQLLVNPNVNPNVVRFTLQVEVRHAKIMAMQRTVLMCLALAFTSTAFMPRQSFVTQRNNAAKKLRVAPLGPATQLISDLTEENQVLRNELVRKDAIIEGLLSTLSATAMTTSVGATPHATPLTDLVQARGRLVECSRRALLLAPRSRLFTLDIILDARRR